MSTASKYFFSSVTRISDLAEGGFDVTPLPQSQWRMADYVVGKVVSRPGALSRTELRSGRMIDVIPGDLIIGAWGVRAATLEAVGHWREVGDDGRFHAMTSAGLFGKVTSIAPMMPPLLALDYQGHTTRDGRKLTMRDFVGPIPPVGYDIPTVLIIGTSMSAGKTTAAKSIVRHLKELGLRVVACKLTGAGRYRDVLAMWDAGADAIFDFVDVGLPSTAIETELFAERLDELLRLVASAEPDVVVAEAGASPLEPYNGAVVVDRLQEQVKCTVLCASDPYAVVGVSAGFGFDPDIVAGVATNTTAAIELVKRLTGQPAYSFLSEETAGTAFEVIRKRLGV